MQLTKTLLQTFVLPLSPNKYVGKLGPQPLLVYERRHAMPPNFPSIPPRPYLDQFLVANPVFHSALAHLHRSAHIRRPLLKYDLSSPLSLTTTLVCVTCPSSYGHVMEH